MKIARLAAATAVAALMTAGAASALTLNYNGPAASSFETVNVTGPSAAGTTPRNVLAGAFSMSEQTMGSFIAFCLDLAATLGNTGTYDTTDKPFTNGGVNLRPVADGGNGGMDRIQKIFDSSYSIAVAKGDPTTSAGFQLALWNAVYDTDWTVTKNDDPINNTTNTFWSNSDAGSDSDKTVTWWANEYLAAAKDWGTKGKNWNLTYLQSTNDPRNQNLVTASPVPLPAAGLMLLGALGGLVGLRRRRKAA